MVLLVICVIVILLSASKKSPTYREFVGRNVQYYAEIANACNELLSRSNYVSRRWIIKGDDKSLPVCLLDLHATKIEVYSDFQVGEDRLEFVWIMIGVTRPGYGITWMKHDDWMGKVVWELTIANGTPKVLYSLEGK